MLTMTMGNAPHADRARPGVLMGRRGERIALQDVEMHATLRDLLCEVRSVQVYRNDEARPIEAVYTFPLPLDAVLLDVHVTLGARTLAGVVVGKQAAEQRYEQAMAEGDGAVMLELAEPGLYTMNVGNLLPGEMARIDIRYALLHRWTGDRLRLHFPTTIAPRYGAMPLAPHQVPEHSLTVENRFAFSLTVHGPLGEAQFTSPSHPLVQGRSDEALILSLASERAVMDRDVVIHVRAPQAARSVLLAGRDGEGAAAVASFQPFFGGLQQEQPLSLAIVVDCSGSMQGDSIAQARRALQHMLAQLQPHDRIGLVAFGSAQRAMHRTLLPWTGDTLARAQGFCDSLEADMGGTEIAQALQRAHALLRGAGSGNVFLITDGQVGAWAEVVAGAQATGHRHFTVGVGTAVTESFVRGLADATHGAAELVSPQEGMSERIVRHFERLRAARARQVQVRWPEGAVEVAPRAFGAVFDGDTLVASARFPHGVPAGVVVLEVETEDGRTHRQSLPLAEASREPTSEPGREPARHASTDVYSTVARIAAALRLATLDEVAAQEMAVRYRLASPYTNWLAIAERPEGEKAQGMPELRTVPQTLAAGWGGTGRVRRARSFDEVSFAAMSPPAASMSRLEAPIIRASPPPAAGDKLRPPAPAGDAQDVSADIPMFFRNEFNTSRPSGSLFTESLGDHDGDGGHGVRERLVALINASPSRLESAPAVTLLRELGLDAAIAALEQRATTRGVAREALALVLLSALCDRVSPSQVGAEGRVAILRLKARATARRIEVARVAGLEEEVQRVVEKVCGNAGAGERR